VTGTGSASAPIFGIVAGEASGDTIGAALIDGVRGVSHVRVYAPQEDIEVRAGEIAVLGQVNLDVRRVA